MAQALGKAGNASKYLKVVSQNFKNVFDASTGFMRGKSKGWKVAGTFCAQRTLHWDDYTEADAWQYTFSVQQDVPGLVKLMGDQAFVSKLDKLFTADSKILNGVRTPEWSSSVARAASEPLHLVAYLYDYAGAPL